MIKVRVLTSVDGDADYMSVKHKFGQKIDRLVLSGKIQKTAYLKKLRAVNSSRKKKNNFL